MTSYWSRITCRAVFSCFLLELLVAAPLRAQESIPLDSLLFEAYPLYASPLAFPAPTSVADTLSGLAIFPDEPQTAAETTIDLYLDSIAAAEAANGPFAQALLEQYLSLGKQYQQNEQHTEAIEVLAKAEYISRINSGLFTSEQFVIVEHLIVSYIALGELREAEKKLQYLLFLNRQNFGANSVQAVPVLRKLADWQMTTFTSVINAGNLFTINIGAGQPSAKELAFTNLYLAQDAYFQAIINLVTNNQFNNPELPELEMKLVKSIFLGAKTMLDNPGIFPTRRQQVTGTRIIHRSLSAFPGSFTSGRDAYNRLRFYEEAKPNVDPLAVARAIVGLGDWHMLFNRVPAALRIYEEADAYLRRNTIAEDVIAGLLYPEFPQQLPVFAPLPHSRQTYGIDPGTAIDFAGYADVSFNLSRYGNVRDLAITGTSGDFTKTMERRLRRLLHSSPFRPRLQQGKASTSAVNIRYYFADARTISPVPQF